MSDISFLCSYLDPLVDCGDTGIFLDLGIKISLDMKQWEQEYQVLKTRYWVKNTMQLKLQNSSNGIYMWKLVLYVAKL